MFPVDRHFMQKNIIFLSSRINLELYVPSLPNDAQLLCESVEYLQLCEIEERD